MTAPVDVAYVDAPFAARAPRRAVLLRMSAACWEDACHDCQDPSCICACEHPWRGAPVLCFRCRRPVTSIRHLTGCDPAALEARVEEITGMVGGGGA